MKNQFAPCPQCGHSNAQKVGFTWWGGIIGPKLLSHVKCQSCNAKYNGKTGKDNTPGIVIYSLVALFLAFFLLLVLFFGLGLLTYFLNS